MTFEATPSPLPALSVLVDAADAGLHRWVHDHVAERVRRTALEEELRFWLNTAAQDLDYATQYAKDAPQSRQPPQAYLDRWLPRPHGGGHVLAGPRYLGRDPDLPFVGVSASDRPLTASDRDGLSAIAEEFSAFKPGFVLVTTADPVDAWPGTGTERRQVVGLLGDLRSRHTPPELTTEARTDTEFYNRYTRIHDQHVDRDPTHARHARYETEEDLQALTDQGLLHDIKIDGQWAGVLAAEGDARRGVRGVTVIELLLDHDYRGLGYGKHLSVLLAKAVPMPDNECLIGTIHADNTAAYRAALNAGRVDVGGEVRIPL